MAVAADKRAYYREWAARPPAPGAQRAGPRRARQASRRLRPSETMAGIGHAAVFMVRFFRMKTMLDIDDNVMRELREAAAREGTTVSALVEAGLRNLLASMGRPKPAGKLEPLPSWKIGTDLVDVANRDALYATMAEE